MCIVLEMAFGANFSSVKIGILTQISSVMFADDVKYENNTRLSV